MEPAGLAIGIPALASLFLKASLQGYEILTDARNVSIDAGDYIHNFRVQRQRLVDWKVTYGGLLLQESESTDRYLLIVQTLARIACLFARIGDIAGEFSENRVYGRDDSQHLSPSTDSRHRHRTPHRGLSRWLKSKSIFRAPSDQETSKQRSSSTSSIFDAEAIVPNEVKREELESLRGKVEKSEISIQGLKWALRDRRRLQELLERLEGYTKSLFDISQPLLSAIAASNEKSPGCVFIVPFPRNPDYVERKAIHKRLDELLLPNGGSQRRAALWALGGMGKTTTAVAYCHRKAESSISVFWVHGNSNETFQASYQNICKCVEIKAPDGDMDALQNAVKSWLESPESGQWIMVIDNLDNLEVESKYIPVRRGSILFTTRDRRILGEPRFAVPISAGVELEKMSFDEAASMCQNLGMDNAELSDSQAELLRLLGNLPLAIAQAAAYIRRTCVSTQQYLEFFKEGENRQMTLLDQPLYHVPDDPNTSQTVMRTWAVTIDRIRVENALAIDVLQFMSVVDPERIPVELVLAAPRFKGIDKIALLNCIGLLLDFALISTLGSSHYRMHRLVSFYGRLSIQAREKRRYVLSAVAESLWQNAPRDILGNLSRCSQLLPHATAVLLHAQEGNMDFDGMQELQELTASIFNNQGEYCNALRRYQQVLEGKERALGKNHLSTLSTVHSVASIFGKQGEYDKALQWYQRVLDGFEQALGKNHPDTLNTIHSMASVFRKQGAYDKALQWYQQALDGREQVLGKNHPDTLHTVHGMALVFDRQRGYEKALQWHQRALDGFEQVLGESHPSTLNTVHNMAIVFCNQGAYDKALQWHQRALDGYKQLLGKNHPFTLNTVHGIALVFGEQGAHNKALQYYQRALDGFEQVLGKNHPSTLTTVHNMALAFNKQGAHDKALQWYQRALDGRERVLGKNHPSTLSTAHCVRKLQKERARGTGMRKIPRLVQKYTERRKPVN